MCRDYLESSFHECRRELRRGDLCLAPVGQTYSPRAPPNHSPPPRLSELSSTAHVAGGIFKLAVVSIWRQLLFWIPHCFCLEGSHRRTYVDLNSKFLQWWQFPAGYGTKWRPFPCCLHQTTRAVFIGWHIMVSEAILCTVCLPLGNFAKSRKWCSLCTSCMCVWLWSLRICKSQGQCSFQTPLQRLRCYTENRKVTWAELILFGWNAPPTFSNYCQKKMQSFECCYFISLSPSLSLSLPFLPPPTFSLSQYTIVSTLPQRLTNFYLKGLRCKDLWAYGPCFLLTPF